jgi:YD repeat-containing protein
MRLLITLAYIVIAACGYSQSADDSKAKETFVRNRIKAQTSLDYAYNGEKPAVTGVKTSLTLYDASGNVSQVTTFNPKGQVLNIEKYKYDTRGNKTEYTRYAGGTEGKAAYQKISKYNEKNQVIEESGFDGVENFKNTYVHNAQGEMTEIRYLTNNVLKEKRIFTKEGHVTHVSIYNAAGTITSKLVLTYDAKKNLVEEAVYGVNQSALEKKTYHYDENKNLKEESKYKLDKITLKTLYNYNSAGNLVDISEESPGSPKFIKKIFTYDAQGNVLGIQWRRKGNEAFNKISYTFDSKGLCTTAETFYPATKYKVLTKYVYEVY